MPVSPFGKKISKEEAVVVRAKLDGLPEHHGFLLLKEKFLHKAELLKRPGPLSLDSVDSAIASASAVKCRWTEAEAIEGVFQWVENAIAFCDKVIEGDKK